MELWSHQVLSHVQLCLLRRARPVGVTTCKSCKNVFCWYSSTSLDDDFLLRHYDKCTCKKKLGHSRAISYLVSKTSDRNFRCVRDPVAGGISFRTECCKPYWPLRGGMEQGGLGVEFECRANRTRQRQEAEQHSIETAVRRVGGSCGMVASLRRRKPRSRGTSTVEKCYQLAQWRPWLRVLVCVRRRIDNRNFCSPINPLINPEPISRYPVCDNIYRPKKVKVKLSL
jgi:hypothetical protein